MIAILGPTASGKSAVAMHLAEKLHGEIISCDSVQVFRGFDIGSAKPALEERSRVPHHLVDVVSPTEPFDAAQYRKLALEAIAGVAAKGRLPLVCGGTGLYFRALIGDRWSEAKTSDGKVREELQAMRDEDLVRELSRIDPKRASEIHPHDRLRHVRALEIWRVAGILPSQLKDHAAGDSAEGPFEGVNVYVLEPPRGELHRRIADRVDAMLAKGLIEEVRGLLDGGCPRSAKPLGSIGYAQVVAFLDGHMTRDELPEKIKAATRQYAKRQCTWFRSLKGAVHCGDADALVARMLADFSRDDETRRAE